MSQFAQLEQQLSHLAGSSPSLVKSLDESAGEIDILLYRHSHEPTQAQIEAGNYKKRKLSFHGLTVSIENEAGSVRRGVDPGGKVWETRMYFPYGYILGSEGVDGDHVDIYLGPDEDAQTVFVVHQRQYGNWSEYDEDKCMLGFSSKEDAVRAFLLHYNDLRFLGDVTPMPLDEFKAKVRATADKPQMIKSEPVEGDAIKFNSDHLFDGGPASGHVVDTKITVDGMYFTVKFSDRQKMFSWEDVRDYADKRGKLWLIKGGSSEPDYGQEMLKAEQSGIPTGARWITVHPNGEGKGQAILVLPQSDGSMKVIGGAGGSLNHLTLTGVGKGGDYKQKLKQKAKDRRDKKKAQIKADKAAGVHESKVGAKSKISENLRKHREDFVRTVAESAGWDPKDLEFDEDKHADLSDSARAKARKDHSAGLMKRARAEVDLNRKSLVLDHSKQAIAGLNQLPLESDNHETLSVDDLNPVPEKAPSLGFDPQYAERAEKKGLTSTSKQEIKESFSGGKPPTPSQSMAADASVELQKFQEINPDTMPPDPKVLEDAHKAVDMLRAAKKLKLAEDAARKSKKEIDNASVVEQKSYVLNVSEDEIDESVKKSIEDDARTLSVVGFINRVDHKSGETGLGVHVSAGGFNSLNSFATAVAGGSLIDRSVVDVLGLNGAAQVLARQIHQSHEGGDLDRVRHALERFHADTQVEKQDTAVKNYNSLISAASEIKLPDGKTGTDLAHAQALNQQRRKILQEAKRLMGITSGELEANAALAMALKSSKASHIEVSLGAAGMGSAITQLHAIGLEKGDYALDKAGDNLVVTINGPGLDKLARPVDIEGLRRIRRNLDIASGKMDEEGWLPKGFADRPDLAMHVEPGVAESLAEPFSPKAHDSLSGAIRSYIGGRAADGDPPSSIVADLLSSNFIERSGGDGKAYMKALDSVVPLRDGAGKIRAAESHTNVFSGFADEYVSAKYGGDRSPLHSQGFSLDQESVDALHRSLSSNPEGVAAFKPVGDLSVKERNGLRKWFMSNVAPKSGGQDEKAALDAHLATEPKKESVDLFNDTATSSEWKEWSGQRDELSAAHDKASFTWGKFVQTMGSPEQAIKSVQDLVRSRVVHDFADHHNKLTPSSPLKVGKTVIDGNLAYLDAIDPVAREKRQSERKSLIDSLRDRVDGKYSSGSVADKLQAHAQTKAAYEQTQMGLFSSEELTPDNSIRTDERYTVGHAAEQKIAGMMSVVGQNFKSGEPTKLWGVSMSGKYAPQQRAIKMLEANKRIALGYGAGSGKTAIYLGGFSHLHGQGKVKRALMLVPSAVQAQFSGEALRYLEPGKFNTHIQPGASREERIAAYKNPDHHIAVMTHEAFRGDMIDLGAGHAGMTEQEMTAEVNSMTPQERKSWAKGVMDHEGINFDATFVDEAHQLLNRQGKENSTRANVIDAVSDNTPYFIYGTGDPAKNDASEIHDVLSKVDRNRYGDRGAFMRAYGQNTIESKAALKRELARNGISNTISPDIKADYRNESVSLSDHQRGEIEKVNGHYSRVKMARLKGEVDVDAARSLSPSSFEGVDQKDHKELARRIQNAAGVVHNAAVSRVIHSSDHNAKIDKISSLVSGHDGKPGVVFARNRDAVEKIRKRLESEGHRVVTLTGSDSAKDKDKKRLMFQPENGEPLADIMVSSDAGAVGLNMQRGSWVVHHDIPATAMLHGQRSARVHRLGQKNDVTVHTLVADHPSEQTALDRLKKKYALREMLLDPMETLDDTGIASYLSNSR